MTYAQNEYYQPPAHRVEIPEAFVSTMKSLEARIPNLHPKNRSRAEGIIHNIRRYNRVTENQKNEIVRLEKLSKSKWKEPKTLIMEWAARVGETPQETYDRRIRQIDRWDYTGPRYANKFQESREQQRRQDFDRAKAALDREVMGDDAYSAMCRELSAKRTIAEAKRDRRWAREDFRRGIREYDRNRHLYYALPTIVQAELIARPQLLTLLRARRTWLLTDHKMQWHKIDRDADLIHVRRALAAEILAHWRDIEQAKILSQDAAE